MTRDELESVQWEKLAAGLDLVCESNRFYQAKFAQAGLRRGDVRDLGALTSLPFTSKTDLLGDQQRHPPYGTNLTRPLEQYVRLHQTSGTSTGQRLRWLDTPESWEWILDCWDQIYDAVGMRDEDRLFFAFSFGPFLGFWAAFDAARRAGRFVLPGGGMSTSARLDAIVSNRITYVLCTPTYALRMAEVAAAEGLALAETQVRGMILAGEPGANIPSTRSQIEQAWNARVYDHSGMTEIGSLGVEYEAYPGKLFLLEDQTIAEYIDPETGEPAPAGELGELVLTNLGRWGSPLIRYRTGDIVRWGEGPTPGGRPYRYLDGGILGRTDDMLWVKGNNVYPSAVESIIRQFPEICEFEIQAVGTSASIELKVVLEPFPAHFRDDELPSRIARTFQNRLSFRPRLEIVAPESLPRYEMKARRFRRIL